MTSLYRCFSAANDLLYVGISLHVIYRMTQHRDGSDWYQEMRTLTVEHFETREEAIAAEREAIRNERPKFNVTHSRPNAVAVPLCSAMTKAQLTEALRQAIESSGMKRAALAELSGISESSIRAAEKGHIPLTHHADDLLRAMGRSLVLGDPSGPPIEIPTPKRRGRTK